MCTPSDNAGPLVVYPGWYLIAEQDATTVTLCLLRLDDTQYVEDVVAKTGEHLPLPAPFAGQIDTSTLLRR
jgi:hypothetical protein